MKSPVDGRSPGNGLDTPTGDVELVVREVVGTVSGHDVEHISTGMELIGELGIESAQILNALMMLEERFDILIEEDELVAMMTVADLIDVVKSKL